MRGLFAISALTIGLSFACSQSAWAEDAAPSGAKVDPTELPMTLPPFEGKIGETYKESEEAWPKVPAPPEGAPNVVVILLDDVGFGQPSTFGGLIPAPNLDKLASEGLRYNRFHTTAICGPSRAALLTGRNHHDTSNGFLMGDPEQPVDLRGRLEGECAAHSAVAPGSRPRQLGQGQMGTLQSRRGLLGSQRTG